MNRTRADAQSSIEFRSNSGGRPRPHAAKMSWRLHLVEREGPGGSTDREAERVDIARVEKRDGQVGDWPRLIPRVCLLRPGE